MLFSLASARAAALLIPGVILAGIAAAQPAPAPEPSPVRVFSDWAIACDNGDACEGVAFPDDAMETALGLRFHRGAESDGTAGLVATPSDTSPGPPTAISATGNRLETDLGFVVARDIVVADLSQGNGARVTITPVIMAGLRPASALLLKNAAGVTLLSASLRGFNAAALYSDVAQRRIGTVTALVRPGSASAASMPAARPYPAITVARAGLAREDRPTPADLARLHRLSGCSTGVLARTDPAYAGRLDPRTTLLLVPCDRGAYNAADAVYIGRRAGRRTLWTPAPFDRLGDAGGMQGRAGTAPMLVNVTYDFEGGRLEAYSKARGLGDCGNSSVHSWDGTRFRLVEATAMPECRGTLTFLTTWRTQVIWPPE